MRVAGSTGISPPSTSGGFVVVVLSTAEVVGAWDVVVVAVVFEQAAINNVSTEAWRIRFVTSRNVKAYRWEYVVYSFVIMPR